MVTSVVEVAAAVVALPVLTLLGLQALRGEPRLPIAATMLLLVVSSTVSPAPVLDVMWVVAYWGSLLLLLATFPDGHFVPGWTVLPVAGFALLGAVEVLGTAPEELPPWLRGSPVLGIVALLGCQVFRYVRRSSIDERARTRWAVLGVLACVTGFAVLGIATGGEIGEGGILERALGGALSVLPVYGFAVGLLRPMSDRVDVAIRWFVTAVLTGAVVAVAYAVVTAATGALGAGAPAAGWWGAMAASAVAVLVLPVARRAADLLVHRGRPDPTGVLSDLGRQVARAGGGMRSVPGAVVELARTSLHLRGVELRGLGSFAAGSGDVGDSAATFPIVYQGEELAVLAAEPRPGESTLTVHDRRVLAHVAQQAGPSLHGARAMADLVDARARLVLAREDERRRLRRDLHDDLAPTLAGLGHVAAAIHRLAGDTTIAPVAAELHEGIAAASRQVREIAYDLRPPVLDDLGLVAALRERVVSSPGAVPQVELRVPDDRLDLPAAVESAALRIVQESVANARQHAAAARCVVSLHASAELLRVEVTDDGRGLPEPVRAGVGLRSVVERATELGGTAAFERLPGHGTRVMACLPIPRATDWESR